MEACTRVSAPPSAAASADGTTPVGGAAGDSASSMTSNGVGVAADGTATWIAGNGAVLGSGVATSGVGGSTEQAGTGAAMGTAAVSGANAASMASAAGTSANGAALPNVPCTPGPEVCDGVDNDCDGVIDNGVKKKCWVDQDGDGIAAAGAEVVETCDECGPLQTAKAPVAPAIDCDDHDKSVSPDATDICGDNLDNDCDGTPDDEANNACDGPCTVQLPGKPGEPCSNGLKGACARTGMFQCQPDHSLACSAPMVTGTSEKCGDNSDNDCDGVVDNGCVKNACGGWTKLSPDKGAPCSMGNGSCRSDGQYVCDGQDKTTCNALPKLPNGCGGCAPLVNLGRSCTADCTSGGQYECDGTDATRCNVTAKKRNTCGGCGTLAHDKNASCTGECRQPAHYQCDGTDTTVCKNDQAVTRNSCGGCDAISSSQAAGTYCSAGMNTCAAVGTFTCTGSGDGAKTACNAKPNLPSNGCGGCVPPNKGESCVVDGLDGTYQCDPASDLTYCVARM